MIRQQTSVAGKIVRLQPEFQPTARVAVEGRGSFNSRPLCPLSSNPQDSTPLTPAHFLVGRPLSAVPESNLQEIPVNRLSRLQHIQQCQQHFWRRWKQEYIADLQRRTKWTTTKGQLHVGDVVLLKEDNSPPLSWKLGRVIQLHPGVDGVSRVATVKISRSDVKRSYAKLCPLPKEDDSAPAQILLVDFNLSTNQRRSAETETRMLKGAELQVGLLPSYFKEGLESQY
ncbi:hypothetical protein NQ317_007687 [Molorchus minor]|uniref:DUF5641 domain-containing protein n=1 Tax=Molorchus minor TaxID=1323400 RepID=A0ABQ9JQD0_9CUCU|nr:hypothetical protein NQ317_007687 [Molorchus minor]